MVDYISVESVRRTSGVGADLIDDTDVTATIEEVEAQVERYYNTFFTPRVRIDLLSGSGTEIMFTNKNPVLSVYSLIIDDTTLEADEFTWSEQSGRLILKNKTFAKRDYQNVKVKYLAGLRVRTDQTTNVADLTAGVTTFDLTDATNFAIGDWIQITGTDGYQEVVKITNKVTNTITVDRLIFNHEADSLVEKLELSPVITKLMNIMSGIALVARVVGQSYDDIVGYTLDEMQVQKGEPYTQWRETATQLQKERDDIMRRVRIRPAIM